MYLIDPCQPDPIDQPDKPLHFRRLSSLSIVNCQLLAAGIIALTAAMAASVSVRPAVGATREIAFS